MIKLLRATFCILLFILPTQLLFAQATHVVISEIYAGGGLASATYTNDYVELYNPTTSDIDLTNWSLQYQAAGTTGAFGTKTTITSGTIRAHGFFLIKCASGGAVGSALPTADFTSTIDMAGSAGKIAICNTTTAVNLIPTGTSNPNLVDMIGYGTTANYAEGYTSGSAPLAVAAGVPTSVKSLERKANSGSTVASLASGADQFLGNGYDSDNNSADIVIQTSPNPQNSSTAIEPVPTMPTSGTLSALSTPSGTASSSTSFTITATNLVVGTATGLTSGGVLVTPPTGFEVSTDNSTFSSSVTVGTTGTLSATTVYIRLAAANSVGPYSGNIVLSTTGISNVNLAMPSSTVTGVSSNADLSSLSLSGGFSIAPAFDAATTSYTVTVPNGTSSITVTPTVADATATIKVNTVAVTSGTASGTIALTTGANTITTVVTAQNASTKTYTITVTVSAPATPTIVSSSPSLSAQSTTYGTPPTPGTFNVSGTDLTAGILVTPPTGFEVSTDNSTFTPTVTVGAAGSIASTPVYVRLASTAIAGTYSGNVALTSASATEVDVAIASSTVTAVLPTITDLPITGVTANKAIMNATINDGGSPTNVGFYVGTVQATVASGGGNIQTGQDITYGLNPIPTIPAGTGNINIGYQDNVVSPGTTYYYQARATNSAGTTVGAVGTFTGLPSAPVPVIAGNSATTLSYDWLAVTGATSYTYDVATTNTFGGTILPAYTNVSTTTTGATVTGLTPGTLYYIRVKATSAGGDGAYSSAVGVVTLAAPNFTATYDFNSASGTSPDLTPVPVVDNATFGSFATTGATTTNAAGRFNASTWGTGTTINTGNYFSVTLAPATGYSISLSALSFAVQRSATGPAKYSVRSSVDGYNADLPGTIVSNTNLTGTSIFTNTNTSAAQNGTNITIGSSFANLTGPVTFRIYAFSASSTGTFSVDNVKFTGTTTQLPTVTTTTPATNIAATTVTLSGNVSSAGSNTLTDEGVVYSASANPTIATGTQVSAGTTTVGAFSSSVTGLTAGTLYHYVAYATSAAGTSYGTDQTFTTVSTSPITSTTGTLSALSTNYGTASTAGTFNVSGANMTAGILVTPPSGFEVSTDNTTFTSTVTVGAAGTIASTPVYIRLTSTAAVASYSGNVVLSSSGASDATVATVSSTVSAAPITITASNATKNYGAAITGAAGSTAYTITSGALKNAETIASISIAYGTGAAANAAVGTYTGSVTPSAATGGTFTASNYTITYATGDIVVGKSDLTITATGPSKTYGTALTAGTSTINFTAGAVASGESVTDVTLTPDAAGLSATTAAGTTYAVTPSAATGAGGFLASNYNITYTPFSGTVGTAPLSITANTANKTYGQSLTGGSGSTAFTSSGLQNGETIGSVAINYSTGSSTTSVVGTYIAQVTPSFATGGNFTASNYTITYNKGDIVIGQAALTVTATGPLKTYGTALTAGTSTTDFTVTGTFAGSETLTSATLTPDAAGLSATTAAGTTYTVTPSAATGAGGFLASNYNITYTAFNGTVSKIPLTVTATGPAKTYGTALSAATSSSNFTVTGTLVSGEALTSITLTPDAAGLSATAAAGASYTVTPSAATGTGGFAAGNYNITYTPFSGTVSKASLSITASTATKTYGQTLTSATGLTYGFASSGLKNSETIGSVTLTYATGAAATANVGTYPNQVTPSGATGGTFSTANYNISYSSGSISVGTAALTIEANGVSKTPATTITGSSGSTAFVATGLQNGETAGTVTITYGAGASAGDPPGTYTNQVAASALTGGTITASNYAISYVPGNIVVGTSTITVNVAGGALQPLSTSFGTASATTTFTVSGSNLSNDITITPPTGFEVASSSGGPFGSTVTLNENSGGVGTTNVYVRLAASTAVGSSYNGNVVASSPGTTSQNVATQTSTVNAVPLTITASNATKTYGATLTSGAVTTGFSLTTGTLKNGNTLTGVTLSYGTGAATTAAFGTYTGSVVPSLATGASGFAAGNYNITYVNGDITVNKAPLTVTALASTKPYDGGTTSSTTPSVSSLVAGDVASTQPIETYDSGNVGTTRILTPSGLVLAGGAISNYSVTYTPINTGVINKAALTITATGPSKTYGTALTAGTSTSNFTTGTAVNGEAVTSVTLTPNAAGLSAGTAAGTSYTVTPSLATGSGGFLESNYNITYTPFSGTVGQLALTATATGPAKTYGTALTTGTSTANFSVTGTPVSGELLTSVTLTPDAAGLSATTAAGSSYTVTPSAATGTGGFAASNYNITYTPFSGTVGKLALTVTATGPAKAYGTTLTAGTSTTNFSITGTPASGEALTSVTLTPDAAGLSASTAAGASYIVTPSAATGTGSFAASNYNITYTPFSGTVSKGALTVTAAGPSKTYGTALTAGTSTTNFSVTGTPASGESLTSVTLTPDAAGLSATTSAGSSYSVTPSAATGTGGFSTNNYTITYTSFNGTVGKAALSITATDKTKTYGQSLVGGSGSTAFTSTGLQNSESVGSVAINYGTGSATNAAVASYAAQVTPSFASGGSFNAANYNISYVQGTIIVGAATLTVTANNVNKTQGAALTGAAGSTAFTITGLQNSETATSVTIAYGTGAATGDAPGTYTGSVVPSALTGGNFTPGNYSIGYVNGDIIIANPAIVTAGTLSAVSTTFGTASGNTSFTVSGTGLSAGITATAPAGFEISTTAGGGFGSSVTVPQTSGVVGTTTLYVRLASTTAAGTYSGNVALSTTGATPVNVATISSTVNKATLTITASNVTKTYGQALTGGTGSTAYTISSGTLQNGNTITSATIAYGTGALATDAVNTYTASATPSAVVGANGFLTSNYTITYTAGDIIINKANLTITATGPSKTYGTALVAATGAANFTAGTTVNGETVTGITLTPDAAGLAASTAAGLTYKVTPSLAIGSNGFAASNYNITYTPFTGTVGTANLTLTASNANKTYGQTLTGAAGSTAFTTTGLQNSDAVGSVTLAYGTGSAATAAVATYTGSVVPSAATGGTFNAANYSISYVAGNIIVGKAALTVSALGTNKVYDGNTTATVTLTDNRISGDVLTTAYTTATFADKNTGTAKTVSVSGISISGGASANYTVNTTAATTANITPATVTVTALTDNKVYTKTTASAIAPTVSTLITGDVIATTPTQVYNNSNVGTGKTLTPSGLVITDGNSGNNYTINYVANTTAIITTKAITVTAQTNSRAYNATTSSSVAPVVAALVTGDVITTAPTQTFNNANVGTGKILTAAGLVINDGNSGNNYSISYVTNTTGVITTATLTYTATAANKVYGAAIPTLAGTVSGFAGADNQASATTGTLAFATTATAASVVGTYAVTGSGLTATNGNYVFAQAAGNNTALTVTPAVLTIAANNASRNYGVANPTFTATYTGFVNGDTQAGLTTQPTLSTTATLASLPGTYPITASGAVNSNYTIGYTAGTLTVAPLTNANLANLTVSTGTLSPAFATATTAYTVTVANTVNSITITPTSADATATIKVNGNPVTSGSASGAITLAIGANVITTIVTAQDGVTKVTYTITVTRPASTNANLSFIALSDGSLSPVFASTTTAYTANVAYPVSTLTFTPTPADPTATLTVNGVSVNNGSATTVPLNPGDNTITTVVTAQDGVTKITYTVIVHRTAAPDALVATNILSPNGDGKNDTWSITDIKLYPNNVVTVYDRGGRVVFTKKGYANDWAATINGSPLTEDTYYYVVDLGVGTTPFTGFITVLRPRK
jgi:gliding motility-associated-like protein